VVAETAVDPLPPVRASARGEPGQPIVGGVGEELVVPLLNHDLERVVVHRAHFCLRSSCCLFLNGVSKPRGRTWCKLLIFAGSTL
jgi:hypothetical protein